MKWKNQMEHLWTLHTRTHKMSLQFLKLTKIINIFHHSFRTTSKIQLWKYGFDSWRVHFVWYLFLGVNMIVNTYVKISWVSFSQINLEHWTILETLFTLLSSELYNLDTDYQSMAFLLYFVYQMVNQLQSLFSLVGLDHALIVNIDHLEE